MPPEIADQETEDRNDIYADATACQSDLEDLMEELREVRVRANYAPQYKAIANAITCLEKAFAYLGDMPAG